jgi:hypothetical protein
MNPLEDCFYSIWRMEMWLEGYGSYQEIDWAVEHHILKPFHKPGMTSGIRKWILRKFGPNARADRPEDFRWCKCVRPEPPEGPPAGPPPPPPPGPRQFHPGSSGHVKKDWGTIGYDVSKDGQDLSCIVVIKRDEGTDSFTVVEVVSVDNPEDFAKEFSRIEKKYEEVQDADH